MFAKKAKIGRNDPCPCGSGRKYKRCHGGGPSAPPGKAAPQDSPPAGIGKPQLGARAAPLNAKMVPASQVPPEVVERALRSFQEQQRKEAERVSKFGHVRPEISCDFHGYKMVAVGGKLLYKAADKCKFFTDILIDYVPMLFGRDWFEQEIAKQPGARHPVMQWRVKGMNFMNSQAPQPDGTYSAQPTGPLFAYMTFAYDLYVVEHNARLDARLLERLKRADQFQGARHELFAEATCLRAGYAIQHENEADGSTRHVEFVATHKTTGQSVSVEAKSKHRPGVLGQPGARQGANALDLPFGKLLNDAIAKNAPHPLVVFLDMNMPFATAQRFLVAPPHRFILRTLDRIRSRHSGRDPINLLVMTNHPQHYTRDEEIAPSPHLLSIISAVPQKPVLRPDALAALHQAANLYGNIPQELSASFGQT